MVGYGIMFMLNLLVEKDSYLFRLAQEDRKDGV